MGLPTANLPHFQDIEASKSHKLYLLRLLDGSCRLTYAACEASTLSPSRKSNTPLCEPFPRFSMRDPSNSFIILNYVTFSHVAFCIRYLLTTDHLTCISTVTQRKCDRQEARLCWQGKVLGALPQVLLSTAQSMSIFKEGWQKYHAMIIFILLR